MVSFSDYDRVTDTLMFLSNNITLNFSVVLSRKNKSDERVFFHYETEYQSKCIGTNNVRGIKRMMTFYFTLDNKNDFGNGLVLRPQDVVILIMIIEKQLFPLFFDKDRIFKIKDNKLVIIGNYSPVVFTQSDYKYLRFTPIILEYENGLYKEGVRFELNNKHEYVDIDIDKFMGFYYILKNTDMYSAACNIVSYAKIPANGIETYSMKGLGGGVKTPNFSETDPIDRNMDDAKNTFFNDIKTKKE